MKVKKCSDLPEVTSSIKFRMRAAIQATSNSDGLAAPGNHASTPSVCRQIHAHSPVFESPPGGCGAQMALIHLFLFPTSYVVLRKWFKLSVTQLPLCKKQESQEYQHQSWGDDYMRMYMQSALHGACVRKKLSSSSSSLLEVKHRDIKLRETWSLLTTSVDALPTAHPPVPTPPSPGPCLFLCLLQGPWGSEGLPLLGLGIQASLT